MKNTLGSEGALLGPQRLLSLVIAQLVEVVDVASIVVRGLDESVKSSLAAQAKEHGRSMEAEVRDILTKAAHRPNIGVALMRAAQSVGGFEDLVIPERNDAARAVDFS
ncbi:hypothetical protein U6G28_05015 [Actinomycetaceae bacterium MB13-C1-2]|nr:hypothetical protein U6G28_05015 [Actinomycetaceae bacterium MB13-C1-2]